MKLQNFLQRKRSNDVKRQCIDFSIFFLTLVQSVSLAEDRDSFSDEGVDVSVFRVWNSEHWHKEPRRK